MKKRFRIVAGLKMGLTLQLSLLALTGCDGQLLLPLQIGASRQKPEAAGKDPHLSGNIPTQLGNFTGSIPTQLGQLSDQDPDRPVIVGQVYGQDQAVQRQLPVYQVVQQGLTAEQASRLGAAFDVQLQQNAAGQYIYLKMPDLPDEEASVLSEVTPDPAGALPPDQGLKRAEAALAQAGIASGHGRITQTGSETLIDFESALAGRPLAGPGALIRFGFDSAGQLTRMICSGRQLRQGPVLSLIPPGTVGKQAFDMVQKVIVQGWNPDLQLQQELVYYAPELGQQIGHISPHYRFRLVNQDGQEILVFILPAVADGPQTSLKARFTKAELVLEAEVRGGKPPYRLGFKPVQEASDRVSDWLPVLQDNLLSSRSTALLDSWVWSDASHAQLRYRIAPDMAHELAHIWQDRADGGPLPGATVTLSTTDAAGLHSDSLTKVEINMEPSADGA